MYFSTYGDGTKPALLFLHSLGVRGSTYTDLFSHLTDSFYIIAPDLPGFGQSPTPQENWTFVEYASAIENILISLHITKVMVVGHSFGGGVGLYLSYKSSRVSKLILISPTSLRYKTGGSIGKAVWGMAVKQTIYALIHPRYWGRFLSVLKDVFYSFFMRNYTLKQLFSVIHHTVTHLVPDDFIVTIPTLLLWSRHEEVVPPDVKQELNTYVSHLKVKEVEGNHNWCFYHAGECAEEIKVFLAD